jgi:hypothetical protein
VDVLVAAFADHKGLSLTHSHQAYPRRPFRPSWLVEIGEFADVVDLQPFWSLAHLALPGEETLDQLISSGRSHDRISVRSDGGTLTLERDSAEAGDQWLPSFIALHRDLEAGTPAAKGCRCSPCIGEPSSSRSTCASLPGS